MAHPAAQGSVRSIHVSEGGVPKRPVPRAAVGPEGLEGDRHRHLEYHGGPERAVCLFSAERIAALQAEGHPLAAGTCGENLVLSGLDWSRLGPGSTLQFEHGLRLQVASYTSPCRILAHNFLEGRFERISESRHPGWSRLYARVLVPGTLREGEWVRVDPPCGLEG